MKLIELETKALSWPDRARALVITNDATQDAAAEYLLAIKALKGEVDAGYDEDIARAKATYDGLRATKARYLVPLLQADDILRKACAAYQDEQRRQAEVKRLEAEAVLRARETDRQLAEAAALELTGQHEEADAVMAEDPLAHVAVQTTVHKSSGLTYREDWSCVVDDLAKLEAYGTANPHTGVLLPRAPNMTTLNALARSLKKAFKVPGCRAVSKPVPVVGGRGRSR